MRAGGKYLVRLKMGPYTGNCIRKPGYIGEPLFRVTPREVVINPVETTRRAPEIIRMMT